MITPFDLLLRPQREAPPKGMSYDHAEATKKGLIMNEMTRTSDSMSRALRIVFLFLLVVGFAACSGDAIVDVDLDPEDKGHTIEVSEDLPFLKLGEPDSTQGSSCSGRLYYAENEVIEVNGLIFASGGGGSGPLCLRFFFGYANRFIYSGGEGDSVNVGLFVYSDEPFEGAEEAGTFEGQELRFSIDGYEVLVASRDTTGIPLLGDGSQTPAYVLHVEDFPGWTTSSGYVIHTARGSAQDPKFILNHDSLEWEFDIDRGEFYINDELVGTVLGLKIQPFGWFFLYGGPSRGGLFVVSDDPYGGAVESGAFEGQELRFEINGYTVRVTTKAPALLGEGRRTPAWVLHLPDFIAADSGLLVGVSSSLESILSGGLSGRVANANDNLHMMVRKMVP